MNFLVLKKKDLGLLMLSEFISLIGTQMQELALSLYVLKTTGSATLFASVLAISIIPQLILGPLAGVFADWYDRKKMIVYLDLLNGIIVGIFTIIFILNGSLSMTEIYIYVIILSVITAFYRPVIGTILPSIVNGEELVAATSLSSFISNLSTLIGPVIGAMLFGIFGIFIILLINSFSYIFASIFEMFINVPKNNKKPEKVNLQVFKNDFIGGIKFIIGKKFILTVVIMAVIVNFTLAPLTIGLVYLSKTILKVSDFQYGLLEGCFAASMMMAPIIMGPIHKKMKTGTILFFSIFTVGILIIIMGIIPTNIYLCLFSGNIIPYLSVLFLCFLVGIMATMANIALSIAFQKTVPLEIMGRVGAVISTGSLASVPLGQMLFGVLFDKVNTSICLVIMGIIPVITMMIFRKNLMKYSDALPPESNDIVTSDEVTT
ncbi:MFS transporter [Clostridium akagii]|uniref:MFS transporter n=1 Tax=Clostridium akagii TaxID=91623 RepID=UPI00047EC131|nr:MFS transporter [Clostridium akagii]